MNSGIAFSDLDVAVLAAYFAAVVVFALWAGRSEKSPTGYFLAGRSLRWPLIGLSYYASNMSGASFVGLTGAAYAYGLSVYNYEWTATLVLILFAFVGLPTFVRAKLFTVPEYLARRFDSRMRGAYAALTVIAIIFIDTAGALFAGGLVISAIFPAVSLWEASIVLALIVAAYTIVGGLRAVVATDALQAAMIIAGSTAILWIGLERVGGWSNLMAELPDSETRLMRPADDDFLPWPGIGGVILLGIYYWALNQYFVQRALGARSLVEAQRGALFGGLLKLPNIALIIVPGMIAAVLYPGLESPDLAFPTLAFELLPIGLRGLILAALIAAMMSSLDSAVNAAASLVTLDFVRPARPQTSDRALFWIGRSVTALIIAIAAVYAPMIANFETLFAYFQATLAYLVPPIVAVYLAGLLWRRANGQGAFVAFTSGLAVGLVLYFAQEATGLWQAAGFPAVHFTYMAMIIFALTLAIMIAVSLATPPPPARSTDAMVVSLPRTGAPQAGHPLADPRWQALALAMMTAALIVAFW